MCNKFKHTYIRSIGSNFLYPILIFLLLLYLGEDGPSQMALEDLAMFRTVRGSTVFYPSDAVATEHAVELAANTKGITFIRTGRPPATVIYDENDVFAIGKGKVR